MKKHYLTPAIKVTNVVINQIIMTSGSDPDPKKDVDLPFINTIEDVGYAD